MCKFRNFYTKSILKKEMGSEIAVDYNGVIFVFIVQILSD